MAEVVARQNNLNKTDGATGHKVCNMTTHPQWNATYPLHRFHIDMLPGNMDYDFAILNLCDPMMFDKGQFSSLSLCHSFCCFILSLFLPLFILRFS